MAVEGSLPDRAVPPQEPSALLVANETTSANTSRAPSAPLEAPVPTAEKVASSAEVIDLTVDDVSHDLSGTVIVPATSLQDSVQPPKISYAPVHEVSEINNDTINGSATSDPETSHLLESVIAAAVDVSANDISGNDTGNRETFHSDPAEHATKDTSQQAAIEVVTTHETQAKMPTKTAGPLQMYRPFRMHRGPYWPASEGVNRGKKWRLVYSDPALSPEEKMARLESTLILRSRVNTMQKT